MYGLLVGFQSLASEPKDRLHTNAIRTHVPYVDHPFAHPTEGRGLQEADDHAQYEPMRITAYYNKGMIPSDKLGFIQSTLMARAIAFFRDSLSVVPVGGASTSTSRGVGGDGHLRLTPYCATEWATPNRTCRIWHDARCGLTTIPPGAQDPISNNLFEQ